jgi:hypothetical protein
VGDVPQVDGWPARSPAQEVHQKTVLLSHRFLPKKRNDHFYQDRLGTDVGKALEEERDACSRRTCDGQNDPKSVTYLADRKGKRKTPLSFEPVY